MLNPNFLLGVIGNSNISTTLLLNNILALDKDFMIIKDLCKLIKSKLSRDLISLKFVESLFLCPLIIQHKYSMQKYKKLMNNQLAMERIV